MSATCFRNYEPVLTPPSLDAIIGLMDLKFSEISNGGFGKPKQVYLFHGPEDVLKRRTVETFIVAFVDKDTRDFDSEILEGSSAEEGWVDRILGGALTAPMGNGRRVVVVNYANSIPADQQECLAKAIEKIPEVSTVIFVEPGSGASKKPKKGSAVGSKLKNAVGKIGDRVEFPTLKPADAKKEARVRFEEYGKKASPAVLDALVQRAGQDISVLHGEIDKVINYLDDKKTVTIEDILEVTVATPEERIWAFLDAVGERNVKASLRALEAVLDAEGRPDNAAPRALAMIARQLRLLWQMRLLMDAGVSNPIGNAVPVQIANLLPSDPNLLAILKKQKYNFGRYRTQARRFTIRELAAAFERLLRADLALKGIAEGPRDPRMVLELLTVDLCGNRL